MPLRPRATPSTSGSAQVRTLDRRQAQRSAPSRPSEHARPSRRRASPAAAAAARRQRRCASAVMPAASGASPSSQSTIRSAPTKSTISPWIRSVRFEASSGWKTSGSRFRVEVPVSSDAEEERAEADADAVLRPSSATAIPTNPSCDVWMSPVESRNCHPSDVDRACEPGERTRDRHRHEVVPRDADAAVARRLGVEPDGLDAVAERRPVEDDPVDDQRGERDEQADVEPLQERVAPEDRELGALDDVLRDRRARRDVLQRAGEREEEDADPDHDPVEHDRRDHLVGADGRLEESGDARRARPRRRVPTTRTSRMWSTGLRPVEAASRRSPRGSSRTGTGPGRRC